DTRSSPATPVPLSTCRAASTRRRTFRRWTSSELQLADLVADRDRAVGEDVGVDAGAMDELLDDPRPRHLLQVEARLAELDAVALDRPDEEALADQVVEAGAAHRQLTSRATRRQADVLDDVLLHQRQRLARLGAVGEVVAVAFEPLARD